jgi:hypothetical protein
MNEINIKQLVNGCACYCRRKELAKDAVMSVIEQAIAAAWRRDNGTREQEVRSELTSMTVRHVFLQLGYVVEELIHQ